MPSTSIKLVAWAACAVVACSGSRPRGPVESQQSVPATPVAQVAPSPPSSAASFGSTAPMLVPVEDVRRPSPLDAAACTFDAGGGIPVRAWSLIVQGHPIGAIRGTVDHVSIRMSEDGSRAVAQLATASVRIEADLDPRDLRLAQRKETAPLDGWIEVRAARVRAIREGTAVLAATWPTSFSPATAPPLEVPCADLTPLRDPLAMGFGDERLKTNVVVPLRRAPNGPVVGTLRGPAPRRSGNRAVALEATSIPSFSVLERKGLNARVRMSGEQLNVVGWIPASALDSKGAAYGLLGLLGSGASSGRTLRCSTEVPLHVRVDSHVYEVGVVKAGGVVFLVNEEGGDVYVSFEPPHLDVSGLFQSSAVQALPLSRPFVPASLASSCAEQ